MSKQALSLTYFVNNGKHFILSSGLLKALDWTKLTHRILLAKVLSYHILLKDYVLWNWWRYLIRHCLLISHNVEVMTKRRSRSLRKNRHFPVKSTLLLKKLIKSWFHEIFLAWSRFIVLSHAVFLQFNGILNSYLARILCMIFVWSRPRRRSGPSRRINPYKFFCRSRDFDSIRQHLWQLLEQLMMVLLCGWMLLHNGGRRWGGGWWRGTGWPPIAVLV